MPYKSSGNMHTLDMLYSAATNKQFITVQARNGATFYLIIDYDKPIDEDAELYETYFLNLVDERDLLALLSDEELPSPTAEIIVVTPAPTAVPAVTVAPADAATNKQSDSTRSLLLLAVIAVLGLGGIKTFDSVESAAAYLKCPIFCLEQNNLAPTLITAHYSLGKLIRVQLSYTIEHNNFSILQKPMLESNVEAAVSSTESITSPAGDITVWESNGKYRGLCISDGWIINMLFDGTESKAIELFKGLHVLINSH